jgi:hypothetical protein
VEARLDDNPYITEEYRQDLEDLTEMRKRQLLYGDWNAFEGQFFSEWRAGVHVADLEIAPDINHFASLDWGYNSPGCVLWWACLSDGRYHIRREFKFKGLDPEAVVKEIRKITHDLGITRLQYLVCDPATKQKDGKSRGESILETFQRCRLPARAGDNDRFNGWGRVHAMLRLDEMDRPWLTVSPSCAYTIRTLPALVQDDNDPEDVDTAKDDHAADALRYGAMSRPSPTRIVNTPAPYPVGSWGYETAWQNSQTPRGVLER